MEKENCRLLTKILKMNSSISFNKFEQQYESSKNYALKEYRIKRSHKYVWFRVFDINMSQNTSSNPDDLFRIFSLENKKKVMIATGTLFELRKMELKIRKSPEMTIKVEGQEHDGTVRFNQSNLMDIMKHGHKVGHIVVEYIKK